MTGSGKAQVLKEILEDGVPYPAQRAAAGANRATWFIDEDAATMLTTT